jgi:hypothetical protein
MMSIRLGQFGGSGGQYSPNAPGGAPNFQGGSSGYAGYGVNNFSGDISMDDLMGFYRKPGILSFERPIESLLETFHDNLEKDAEPYLLDFDERVKLNLKKKIRNKEQHLKDLAKEKTPEENPIPKKIKTVEELLHEFRRNDDIDFSKMASKTSSYYRPKSAPPLLDQFLPTVEEYEDEENPLNLTGNKLKEPWLGPYDPMYEPEDGIDKYVQQQQNPQRIDMHAYFTGLMDAWQPGTSPTFKNPKPLYDLPSLVTPESKKNDKSLQGKLDALKNNPNQMGGQGTNLEYTLDWDRMTKGQYPERGVTNETPYTNSGLNDYSQNDMLSVSSDPMYSRNPYFGVSIL